MLLDLWGLFQRDTRKIKGVGGGAHGAYVWNQRKDHMEALIDDYDDEDEIVSSVIAQAAFIYYWAR